eukprot:CAMPEP_0172690876 /NCGR_PEP_ID=MMETSP1074-20121228/24172_1 /TAXON_ID=2916 /ORGANISM="Ceratium fusus, Strain PA161109" /LENGTH=512 /DNA_ID=CAMNT_0013510879 /DNA_START=80 /DNA_END=1614 /DNA_ORIENTATION=-
MHASSGQWRASGSRGSKDDISTCARDARWDEALALLVSLRLRRASLPSIAERSSIVAACARVVRWQEAAILFTEWQCRGAPVELWSCSAAIHALAESARWEQALAALSAELRRTGEDGERLVVDEACYNAALSACRGARRWANALALLVSAASPHAGKHQHKRLPLAETSKPWGDSIDAISAATAVHACETPSAPPAALASALVQARVQVRRWLSKPLSSSGGGNKAAEKDALRGIALCVDLLHAHSTDASAADEATLAAAARAVWRRLHAPTVDALEMLLGGPRSHSTTLRAPLQRRSRSYRSLSGQHRATIAPLAVAAAATVMDASTKERPRRMLAEVPAVDAALGREALAVLLLPPSFLRLTLNLQEDTDNSSPGAEATMMPAPLPTWSHVACRALHYAVAVAAGSRQLPEAAGITAAAGLDSVQIAALATVAVRAAKVALAVMAAAATPALQARLPLQRWYWQQTVSIQSPPSAHCTEATGHTAAIVVEVSGEVEGHGLTTSLRLAAA